MPAGRPTKYKPEYCEKVVELGKEGKSPAQIAGMFDIARESLYDWAEAHPEFSTALRTAKTFEQVWWEELGQKGATGENPDINPQVWKTSVQARFREDYTERRDNTHSGPDGGPVQVSSVTRTIIDPKAGNDAT